MIVKKYQAPTQEEAIIKARDELGPTAVVLNSKILKQRGIMRLFKKDVVEITASLEEDEIIKNVKEKKPTFESRKTDDKSKAIKPESNSTIDYRADEEIDLSKLDDSNDYSKNSSSAIDKKLDSLHMLLAAKNGTETASNSANNSNNSTGSNTRKTTMTVSDNSKAKPKTASTVSSNKSHISSNDQILKDDSDKKTDSDISDEEKSKRAVKERESENYRYLKLIYKNMVNNEVDEKYADLIIGEIESSLKKETTVDSILAAVYQKIILKLGEPKKIETGEKAKVVIFIGPTGVGKTTTIAKIASQFKLEHRKKVAFITADTYRIAAVEQLNTYAAILDCPATAIYSPDEVDEALDEYKKNDLIFIDTAGRSHKSEEQMDELNDLIAAIKNRSDEFDLEIFLTLSVTTKYKDLIRITEKYKDIEGWSIIFTKLDETYSLGNILNIRLLTDAKLSYTTAGQDVPDDIEIIDEQKLAKLILGRG